MKYLSQGETYRCPLPIKYLYNYYDSNKKLLEGLVRNLNSYLDTKIGRGIIKIGCVIAFKSHAFIGDMRWIRVRSSQRQLRWGDEVEPM